MDTHKLIIGWQKIEIIDNRILKYLQNQTFKVINSHFFDKKEFNSLPESARADNHQVLEYMEGSYEECEVIRKKMYGGKSVNFKDMVESIKRSKYIRLLPIKSRSSIMKVDKDKTLNTFDKASAFLFKVGIYFYVDIKEINPASSQESKQVP